MNKSIPSKRVYSRRPRDYRIVPANGRALCTYADFGPSLPVPTPREHVLRLSKLGRFPRYTRPAGFHSEPVFSTVDVMAWLRTTYGDLLPEYVAQIEREGFAKAKPSRAG